MSVTNPAATLQLLASADINQLIQGIRALADFVESQGRDPDLSDLWPSSGSPDTETINKVFETLAQNHLENLDTQNHLLLIRSLFNGSGFSERSSLAVPFLRKAAANADADTEGKLFDLYTKASTYYDDGHLEEDGTTRDVYVEEVFPGFTRASLMKVIHWVLENNYLQDLGRLLPVVCARKGLGKEDRNFIFSYFEDCFQEILAGNEALSDIDEDNESPYCILGKCIKQPGISQGFKVKLNKLRIRIQAKSFPHEAFLKVLKSKDISAIENVFLSLGQYYPPRYLISEIGACGDALLTVQGNASAEAIENALIACFDFMIQTGGNGSGKDWADSFYVGVYLIRFLFDLGSKTGMATCRKLQTLYKNKPDLIFDFLSDAAGLRRVNKDYPKDERFLFCDFKPEIEKVVLSLMPENEQQRIDQVVERIASINVDNDPPRYLGYIFKDDGKTLDWGIWIETNKSISKVVIDNVATDDAFEIYGGEIDATDFDQEDIFLRHIKRIVRSAEFNRLKTTSPYSQYGESIRAFVQKNNEILFNDVIYIDAYYGDE